jgi:hypothetical protein
MKASCDDPGVVDDMCTNIKESSPQQLPGHRRSRFGYDSRKIEVVRRQEGSDAVKPAIDIGSSRWLGSLGLELPSRLRRASRWSRAYCGRLGRWRRQREKGGASLAQFSRVTETPDFRTRNITMEVVLQVYRYVLREQLYMCKRNPDKLEKERSHATSIETH